VARHFNGTTDVIDAGIINLDTVSRQVFASVWVKPDTVAPAQQAVMGRWNNTPSEQWFLAVNTGGAVFFALLDSTSTGHTLTSVGTISAGVWSLIGCSFDGAHMRVYINGALDNSAALSANMNQNSTEHFLIGVKGDGNPYAGAIAEPSVFNGVGNAPTTTMLALYNGATPWEVEGMIAPSGHVGYWPLLGWSPEIEPATTSITGTTVVDHPPVRTATAFRF